MGRMLIYTRRGWRGRRTAAARREGQARPTCAASLLWAVKCCACPCTSQRPVLGASARGTALLQRARAALLACASTMHMCWEQACALPGPSATRLARGRAGGGGACCCVPALVMVCV